jgi:hypothetical protein
VSDARGDKDTFGAKLAECRSALMKRALVLKKRREDRKAKAATGAKVKPEDQVKADRNEQELIALAKASSSLSTAMTTLQADVATLKIGQAALQTGQAALETRLAALEASNAVQIKAQQARTDALEAANKAQQARTDALEAANKVAQARAAALEAKVAMMAHGAEIALTATSARLDIISTRVSATENSVTIHRDETRAALSAISARAESSASQADENARQLAELRKRMEERKAARAAAAKDPNGNGPNGNQQ